MHRKSVSFVLIVLFILVLAGCDMFESIKENMSADKKAKNKPAQAITMKKVESSAPAKQPAGASNAAALPANVLASVGEWSITLDEFNKRLQMLKQNAPEEDISSPEVKAAILDEVVKQQMLIADAEKKGLERKPEIVEALKETKNMLLLQEVVNELTKDIKVTDEDAKKFYDANKDKLIEPREFHVREIVVGSQAKAAELFAALTKGADFATTAKENSTSKTASQGGDLGLLKETEPAPFPEMGSTILAMKAGDISNPFNGPNGVYIIKLEEVKGGKPLDFEKIKQDIIANETSGRARQAITEYLKKLQQEINVKVNPDLLIEKK